MPSLIVLAACAGARPPPRLSELPELPRGAGAEIEASLDGAPVLQGVGQPSMCAELSTGGAVQFGLVEGRAGCPVREIRGGMGTVIDRVSICQELMVEVKEAKVGTRQAVDGSTRAQVWYVRQESPPLQIRQPGWITIERLETLGDGRRFVQFTARLEAEHVFAASGWVVATPRSCLMASLEESDDGLRDPEVCDGRTCGDAGAEPSGPAQRRQPQDGRGVTSRVATLP